MEGQNAKKMKILCLHGFRTSGSFLNKQISKWDPSLFDQFDLVFPDGKFPAGGKSDIEGIFPPPYFEWFQFNKEFTEYTNLEECISYLCEYITTNGPFDGLLGFSQGATLSALLMGYQTQGKVLKEHPPMKLFVSISGSKFRDPSICDVAYKDIIKVKSVHFIGEKDWLKLPSEELATAFDNSLIIRHPQAGVSVLGGVDAEMPVKVGVSIGWLQYSWIWFQEFFKISSDHSMLLVSIYCWRLSMLLLLTSIGLQQIEESNSAFGVCLA
ncbi:hypothetical protein K1719_027128 [Acacia pycnantha]|nr:hypothetical protein K1719_027128 [Acacia pycnantha]